MMSWPRRSNRQMFDKFLKIMREEMADVKFIFEPNGTNNDKNVTGPPAKKIARRGKSTASSYENSLVGISVHKKVLAASSPVFNAMFNGPLKETGDVKINDVSPDAFREFLQIFYDESVNLAMKNLGEVMKLIDKYDVAAGWPIVDTFFKINFAVDDILWSLQLAVKYRREDLTTHCTNIIEKNSGAVCDMIAFDGDGKPKLRSNPKNRPMSDADLANIYSRVYASIKNYVSNSAPIKEAGVMSVKLQRSFGTNTIDQIQDISFSTNITLLLTHITYPEIYTSNSRGPADIEISIAGTRSNHGIPINGGIVKFLPPIVIQPNRTYTNQTKIIKHPFPSMPFFAAHKIPREPVQFVSNVKITFDKAHSSSIVAAMNCLRYDH